MGHSATLLLTHRPAPARCDEIAFTLAEKLEVEPWQLRWEITDDVPPIYDRELTEQLQLHRMTAPPEAVYFTVTIDEVEL